MIKETAQVRIYLATIVLRLLQSLDVLLHTEQERGFNDSHLAGVAVKHTNGVPIRVSKTQKQQRKKRTNLVETASTRMLLSVYSILSFSADKVY